MNLNIIIFYNNVSILILIYIKYSNSIQTQVCRVLGHLLTISSKYIKNVLWCEKCFNINNNNNQLLRKFLYDFNSFMSIIYTYTAEQMISM